MADLVVVVERFVRVLLEEQELDDFRAVRQVDPERLDGEPVVPSVVDRAGLALLVNEYVDLGHGALRRPLRPS